MAIIIPHQLPLAPHPLSPLPFSADRFPIHSGPLFCFHQSAPPFPLFRFLVPFGRLLHFLQFICSFSSVRFYELLLRSQLLSLLVLSPLLSGIFVPLKSDTRLSTFETMPFNVRDHALLAPRPRPSTFKNTPFFLCLLMCLISCQLRVRFCPILPSLRRDFCAYSR